MNRTGFVGGARSGEGGATTGRTTNKFVQAWLDRPFQRLSPSLTVTAKRLRRPSREAEAVPALPGRRNRKRTVRYVRIVTTAGLATGDAVWRCMGFRRIAIRYGKHLRLVRSL